MNIKIYFTLILFSTLIAFNGCSKDEAPAAPPAPSKEEVLLTEIRDLLKK